MISFENFLKYRNIRDTLFCIEYYEEFYNFNEEDLKFLGMLVPDEIFFHYTDIISKFDTDFKMNKAYFEFLQGLEDNKLRKIQRIKDKEISSKLIDIGYMQAYKRYHFLKFKYNRCCDLGEFYNFTENDLKLLGMLTINKLNKSCDRCINNKQMKSNNIRKKVQFLLDNYENNVFITLTFTDKFLDSTNPTTRRQYVKRFFNSQNLKYIANIDFGQNDKFTKREHYHAICNGKVDRSLWQCGNLHFEKIKNYGKSAKLLGKYVNKLVNHTIKKGACSTRLLCSQKFFEKSC